MTRMAKAFSGKKPQHFGNTIRVFLNYLGRHKFMLGLVGVLTAVSALANLLGTYMIKPVVNGILETGSIPGLVRGVALTAAIYAVGALSTLGYTQTMVRAAQKVLHDIRRDLFAHLQTLPLSFFDSRRNGELMSLFTYCMNILTSLMMVAMVFVMISMSMASARRISEVLSEDSSLTNGENPVMEVADGSIDFEDASFAYKKDGAEVLSHIDLHIPAGSTIGILGGTGSAKSSLVQLVPRLYDVTDGSLKVGGVDVRDYDMEVLRDQVAMVLQKNVLFSGTIAENLRWGNPNATDEEIRHACQLAQADGFIQEFPDKYDTYIEQGGTNVSGGQRQRLCIARALLKKPKILILDDSTSAVDTKTDKLIREAFHNEIPDTTKIIIAQRIASVQESDMILVMEEGRITASGTHEELLRTCDEYRSIYESQTKNQAQPEELK
jgi:ATP-binding cassette subfamily B multidrug efflux pump